MVSWPYRRADARFLRDLGFSTCIRSQRNLLTFMELKSSPASSIVASRLLIKDFLRLTSYICHAMHLDVSVVVEAQDKKGKYNLQIRLFRDVSFSLHILVYFSDLVESVECSYFPPAIFVKVGMMRSSFGGVV